MEEDAMKTKCTEDKYDKIETSTEKYKDQRHEYTYERNKTMTEVKNGIHSPGNAKENDTINILRIVTSPPDHIDRTGQRMFNNCRKIPIDMPDEEFLPPNECQRQLSYRY